MSTGYKIYFFIKEVLCYVVLGVVLLPLRFILSGGFLALCGSLAYIGALLGGNAKLAEAPPIGAFLGAFLKWFAVFAVSAIAWAWLYTSVGCEFLSNNPPSGQVVEAPVFADAQPEE